MKFIAILFCIWLFGIKLASAEKFSLVELSNYFNTFDTFQADFHQLSDDGSIASGVILIKKPGRLRIDYERPEDLLILASGGQLAIFDPKGDPEPTSFPLNVTPFSIVLKSQINLVGSSNILCLIDQPLFSLVRTFKVSYLTLVIGKILIFCIT